MTPDASPGRIAFASPSDNYGAVIMKSYFAYNSLENHDTSLCEKI